MKLYLKIVVVLIITAIYSWGQSDPVPVSFSEKFNKRGIDENDDLRVAGKEIISDYDGNLMLQYSTFVNAYGDLSGDFTVTFNSNVSHKMFEKLSAGQKNYSVNTSEWIFGYKGFAVQTMNFENHLFLKNPVTGDGSDDSEYFGQKAPLLITGYHFSNAIHGSVYSKLGEKDQISILRADGSVLSLLNTETQQNTGVYLSASFDDPGFGYVEQYQQVGPHILRTLFYYPGDGLVYQFKEEEVEYIIEEGQTEVDTNNDFFVTAFYLQKISNQYVNIEFFYSNNMSTFALGHGLQTLKFGRKHFVGTKSSYAVNQSLEGYDLMLRYNYEGISDSYYSRFVVENYNYDEKLYFYTSDYSNHYSKSFNIDRDDNFIRRAYVNKVIDSSLREDKIQYHNPKNENVMRTYNFDSITSYFYLKSFLIEKIDFHTRKSYEYEYYSEMIARNGNDLDETGNVVKLGLETSSVNRHNVSRIFRDPFTNYMLKNKYAYNKFNSRYNQEIEPEYKINYRYTRDETDDTLPREKKQITNIFTTIIKECLFDINCETTKPLVNVKNYSMFNVNDYVYLNFYSKDVGSTIKLMRDSVFYANQQQNNTTTIYTYKIGNEVNGHNSAIYYDGTFDIESIVVKKYQNDSQIPKVTLNTSFSYNYKTIQYGSDSITRKKLIITKTETDPLGFIIEKDFINLPFDGDPNPIILASDFVNGIEHEYFLKLGLLVEEEKKKNNVKSHRKYVYDTNVNNDYSVGKVLEEINLPGSRQTRIINSYDHVIGNLSYGMLVSKTNDLGLRWNYFYPTTFNQTIKGKIYTPEEVIKAETQSHTGFQSSPNITKIYDDGSLKYETEAYYNIKGKIMYKVDMNGFFSVYDYDKLGRITGIALPGSFTQDGGTNYSSKFYYDDENNYQANQTDIKKYNYDNLNVFKKSRFRHFSEFGELDTENGKVGAYKGDKTYDRNSDEYDYVIYKGNIRCVSGFTVPKGQVARIGPNTEIPEIIEFDDDLRNFESRQEYDSFGRLRKEYVEGELKKSIDYDYLGNVIEERDGTGVTTNYEYDYLNRVTKVTNNSKNKSLEYITANGVLIHETDPSIDDIDYVERIIETDQELNKVTTYYDQVGNKVAVERGSGANKAITRFYYNDIYQLVKVISPEKLVTTYSYDEFGNIATKHSPDEGSYIYKHDKFGRLRFELHTSQKDANDSLSLVFHTYDNFNRLLSTGIYPIDLVTDLNNYDIDSSNPFESDHNNLVLINAYDEVPNTQLYSAINKNDLIEQRFTKGKLAITMYRDKPTDVWKYKLYSYDPKGNIRSEFINE